jgi:hypothetical protein
MELSIWTWASIKPGLMKGREEQLSMGLMERIFPSLTAMAEGAMVLDMQSTRFPLMVNEFIVGKLRRIWLAWQGLFTACVEIQIINMEVFCLNPKESILHP